jgi:hypothetical protein
MVYKRYVDVQVLMKKDGSLQPLAVYWQNEDGISVRFAIDRIIESTASSRVSESGSVGRLFTVVIKGQRRRLYLEKNRWFIESLKG